MIALQMNTAKNTMFLVLPPHLSREKAVFVGRGMGISASASTVSSEGDLQMRKAELLGEDLWFPCPSHGIEALL